MSADVSESLDDFFAKKDKKKKTKKTKIAFTPDDYTPVTEKPKKKKNKTVTTTPTTTAATSTTTTATTTTSTTTTLAVPEDAAVSPKTTSPTPPEEETLQIEEADLNNPSVAPSTVREKGDEDEWKDYEAEKEADYSGLRIQKLNIQEDEEEEEEDVEYDDDGKAIPTIGQVWKIPDVPSKSQTPEPTTEVQSTVGLETKKPAVNGSAADSAVADASSSNSQKYIPPAMKAAMKAAAAGGGGGSASRPGGPRRNPKTAPDISNEELFPTLGGKVGVPSKGSAWGGGGSREQSPLAVGGKLITDVSLQNKWDALTRGAE